MKLRFGFAGRRNDADEARLEARKQAVRAALGLAEDAALSINEITCPDPACPVLETVILVMEPGQRTRAIKLHGALEGLEGEALAAALAAAPRG
jgi:hypothetical protein